MLTYLLDHGLEFRARSAGRSGRRRLGRPAPRRSAAPEPQRRVGAGVGRAGQQGGVDQLAEHHGADIGTRRAPQPSEVGPPEQPAGLGPLVLVGSDQPATAEFIPSAPTTKGASRRPRPVSTPTTTHPSAWTRPSTAVWSMTVAPAWAAASINTMSRVIRRRLSMEHPARR
jgi:hypothetical protein